MALQLRSPDDVKRLFSALRSELPPVSELTLADVDALALAGGSDSGGLSEIDMSSLGLSLLVALATGWVAIRGYERGGGSMGWGLAWGLFGYLLPLPAVAASYYQDVTAD
jgi:hypothetical protein